MNAATLLGREAESPHTIMSGQMGLWGAAIAVLLSFPRVVFLGVCKFIIGIDVPYNNAELLALGQLMFYELSDAGQSLLPAATRAAMRGRWDVDPIHTAFTWSLRAIIWWCLWLFIWCPIKWCFLRSRRYVNRLWSRVVAGVGPTRPRDGAGKHISCLNGLDCCGSRGKPYEYSSKTVFRIFRRL